MQGKGSNDNDALVTYLEHALGCQESVLNSGLDVLGEHNIIYDILVPKRFRPTLRQPSSSSQCGPALPIPATGVECHSSTDSDETSPVHEAKMPQMSCSEWRS